jgi:pimeloyl-ACP methyl ester carboxylesterase
MRPCRPERGPARSIDLRVSSEPTPFSAESDGVELSGEESGQGVPVILLHGLTATRRYVVMGSRSLERSGHRVIAYDARGHGRSSPARDPLAYRYEQLAGDLETVLDAAGVERAVLAGASMGAHTALRFALRHPERVAALGLITPAFDPGSPDGEGELARWDALSNGLREGGVEGFVRAYDLEAVPERWRETVGKVLRQRLALHEHPEALADALKAVPRSRPFETLADLASIAVPTLVVASRDEADPGHPLAVGELYARTIPGARLAVEEEGPPARSPVAWQGGALSKLLAELAAEARL